MGRVERRAIIKKLKKTAKNLGLTDEMIRQYAEYKDKKLYSQALKEGELVKLNYEKITSEPIYRSKTEVFRNFIEDNKETVFTVKYDAKYAKDPWLVSLEEDTTNPRWLFVTDDLIKYTK